MLFTGSTDHSPFAVKRGEHLIGSYTPPQLRHALETLRICAGDQFYYQGQETHLSLKGARVLLSHLEDGESLLYLEENLCITDASLIIKDARYDLHSIESVSLLLPETTQATAGQNRDRAFYIILSILMFWTIIIPVAAWYLSQKETAEEGLGLVHGVQITGPFGSVLLNSGIGLIEPGSPKDTELKKLYSMICEKKKN